MIKGQEETKYAALVIQSSTTPANMGFILDKLDGNSNGTYMQPVIPAVGQGSGSNNRIGDVITPTKFVVHVKFFFDSNFTNQGVYHIRNFLASFKGIKDQASWLSSTRSIAQANMIDQGDGSQSYPDFGSGDRWVKSEFPLNTRAWTRVGKGSKIIRIAKNPGPTQQSAVANGAPLMASYPTEVHLRMTCKLPKLKYANTGSYYPDNVCPLWGACAFAITNGQTYLQQLGAVASTGVPTNPIIRYTLSSELWFKDA